MAEPQGDLVQRVRYGIGLVRSDAEDWRGNWRADMQLKVCADMDLVLSELEQLKKENEVLKDKLAELENYTTDLEDTINELESRG